MNKQKRISFYVSPDEKVLNKLNRPDNLWNRLPGNIGLVICIFAPLILAIAAFFFVVKLPPLAESLIIILAVSTVAVKIFLHPDIAGVFAEDLWSAFNDLHNWLGYLGMLGLITADGSYNITADTTWVFVILFLIGCIVSISFMERHRKPFSLKTIGWGLFIAIIFSGLVRAAILDINVKADFSQPQITEASVISTTIKPRPIARFSSTNYYHVNVTESDGTNKSLRLPYQEFVKIKEGDIIDIYRYQGLFYINWCEVKHK